MDKAKWSISAGYPDGWVVNVTAGRRVLSRYYGRGGGEWELRNGSLGQQLEGTLDVRAPRDRAKFGRWVRRRLAEDVLELTRGW